MRARVRERTEHGTKETRKKQKVDFVISSLTADYVAYIIKCLILEKNY